MPKAPKKKTTMDDEDLNPHWMRWYFSFSLTSEYERSTTL